MMLQVNARMWEEWLQGIREMCSMQLARHVVTHGHAVQGGHAARHAKQYGT